MALTYPLAQQTVQLVQEAVAAARSLDCFSDGRMPEGEA